MLGRSSRTVLTNSMPVRHPGEWPASSPMFLHHLSRLRLVLSWTIIPPRNHRIVRTNIMANRLLLEPRSHLLRSHCQEEIVNLLLLRLRNESRRLHTLLLLGSRPAKLKLELYLRLRSRLNNPLPLSQNSPVQRSLHLYLLLRNRLEEQHWIPLLLQGSDISSGNVNAKPSRNKALGRDKHVRHRLTESCLSSSMVSVGIIVRLLRPST